MITAQRLSPSSIRQFLVSALQGAGYSGGPVLIKPNLGGREPLVPGENTSASLLADLVGVVREFTSDRVLLAHGSLLDPGGGRVGFDEIVRASGYQRLAAEPGVQPLPGGLPLAAHPPAAAASLPP